MHTSDPRMTAIAAYATAYAQYEIDNGKEPSADDAIPGDLALEKALATATTTREVSRKIDQIRALLATTDAETSTGKGSSDVFFAKAGCGGNPRILHAA